MDYKFLRCLEAACVDENAITFQDGRNLYDLYERCPETGKAKEAFYHLLDYLHIDDNERDAAADAAGDLEQAAEWQGFLNGWKLCFRLMLEAAEKSK